MKRKHLRQFGQLHSTPHARKREQLVESGHIRTFLFKLFQRLCFCLGEFGLPGLHFIKISLLLAKSDPTVDLPGAISSTREIVCCESITQLLANVCPRLNAIHVQYVRTNYHQRKNPRPTIFHSLQNSAGQRYCGSGPVNTLLEPQGEY